MFQGPTTISNVARLVGETLKDDYGIDPGTMFRDTRIDPREFQKPGSRLPFSKMNALWKLAAEASKDPGFGIRVGARVTPGDFFVLGHAWIASETLRDAFQRLARFVHVLSTDSSLEVHDDEESCTLVETYATRSSQPQPAALDAGFAALIRMCDLVTTSPVRPRHVVLPSVVDGRGIDYAAIVCCSVEFGDTETWEFSKADVETILPGSIPEVAKAVEAIADEYLASLDEGAVAREVREALIRMMPSGKSDQDTIARQLHRSRSTLQRQLVAEGTNYRQILESTRRSLAEKYLRSNDYSQADVAFMLGFTDQSNFARAFRRWTGMTPGNFQKAA